jgi:outer membrane protein assembly factor BamD (BamD/ComL family)
MNRHKSIPILIFALTLLILGAIVGCKSSPPPLDQDLSPTEFFQKAQEASDDGKYALATRYYEAFLVKYPDDRDRGLWARYEIALLKYKMGDDAAALSLFDELIALYAGGPADLPQGPRILAEKLKAKIESKRQATPSPATP